MQPFSLWFIPERLCKWDCPLCPSPMEHNTQNLSAQVYKPVPVCVFCAGTLLIGAQTWTECSTSIRATGQCSSSGSWTERRTPGTTSPSSPWSSVSAARREADISSSYSFSQIGFLELLPTPECCVLSWKGGVLSTRTVTASSPSISW